MQKVTDVLSKDMTRKEFITTVGFGLATMAGLSVLLRLLGKDNPWQTTPNQAATYGSGTYGGTPKN
jgi:hypothetical protein